MLGKPQDLDIHWFTIQATTFKKISLKIPHVKPICQQAVLANYNKMKAYE